MYRSNRYVSSSDSYLPFTVSTSNNHCNKSPHWSDFTFPYLPLKNPCFLILLAMSGVLKSFNLLTLTLQIVSLSKR